MNYPVAIHKDKGSDYGVIVPDLPGCFSAGRTLDEALAMAKEAIELHLEGLIEEGQVVPRPDRIEDHKDDPDYKGGIWAIVTIDPSNLRLKAKRINITVPERILDAIDRAAKAENETRSGLLVKAATAFISGRGRKGTRHGAETRKSE
jgi:predicted RNase H-like HicB family nuclease